MGLPQSYLRPVHAQLHCTHPPTLQSYTCLTSTTRPLCMEETNIRQPTIIISPLPNHPPLLDTNGIHQLQEIFGVLLFYPRYIYPTIIVALGTLELDQIKGTQAIDKAITQLLNYCATHPDAQIRFSATCIYMYTIIPPIYPNPRPDPSPMATSFSETNHWPTLTKTNHIFHPKMASCISYHPPSNMFHQITQNPN